MERAKLYIYPIQEDGTWNNAPKIDVSKYILGDGGIGSINITIDSSDFVVGVFSYDSCQVKLANKDGKFSLNERLSLFPFGRHNSKAEIYYVDTKYNKERILYVGLINESSIKEDLFDQTIRITLVSVDSLINQIIIDIQQSSFRISYPAVRPSVNSGKSLHSVSELITSVTQNTVKKTNNSYNVLPREGIINFSDIDKQLDFVANITSWLHITNLSNSLYKFFNKKSLKDFLSTMMVITNSFTYYDLTKQEIVIGSRKNKKSYVKKFYGEFNDENDSVILGIKNLNSGIQRVFNSISMKYTGIEVIHVNPIPHDEILKFEREYPEKFKLRIESSSALGPEHQFIEDINYVQVDNIQAKKVVKPFSFIENTLDFVNNLSIKKHGLKTKEIDLTCFTQVYYALKEVGYDTEGWVRYFLFPPGAVLTNKNLEYIDSVKDKIRRDGEMLSNIGFNLLKNYSVQKREMVIIVKMEDAYNLQVGDVIVLSYRKKTNDPIGGASIYGEAVYGESEYCGEEGSFSIEEDVGFFVYGIKHNLSDYITELKIREYGITEDDAGSYTHRRGYDTAQYGNDRYS